MLKLINLNVFCKNTLILHLMPVTHSHELDRGHVYPCVTSQFLVQQSGNVWEPMTLIVEVLKLLLILKFFDILVFHPEL